MLYQGWANPPVADVEQVLRDRLPLDDLPPFDVHALAIAVVDAALARHDCCDCSCGAG